MRSVCDFSITAVDPERLDTALPAHLRRVLEAARLTPSEVIALSPVPNDRLIAPALANQPYREIPPHCYCDSYEKIPVYTPASDSQLVGKLRSVGSDDGTSYVALEKHWTARAPAQCGSVVNGTDGSAAGQDVAIQAQLKPLEDALTKFENGDLSAYNAQRALVFTTYKLLDATRSTRSALARLAA